MRRIYKYRLIVLSMVFVALLGSIGVYAKTKTNTAEEKKIKKNTVYEVSNKKLKRNQKDIYPIRIMTSGDYNLHYDYIEGWGDALIFLKDSDGDIIVKDTIDSLDGWLHGWDELLYLDKGVYTIEIAPESEFKAAYLNYVVEFKSISVETTVKISRESCSTEELKPHLGKGNWTTSDDSIVKITDKKPKEKCNIQLKNIGTAVVTYTNNDGAKIEYEITVTEKPELPIDDASCNKNSVGGLEPRIKISNNSDVKIKYIYLTVSFYNAVGDRVNNDIGGYKQAKLKITGPVKAWETTDFSWDPVFYNSSAKKMKIEEITVEYYNGKKKTVSVNKKYPVD